MEPVIRRLQAGDERGWRELWGGYQAFYRAAIPAEVTALTFGRLLDHGGPFIGLVAEDGARLQGLAHAVVTWSTWSASPSVYLNDLFVAAGAKRSGVGRKLVEAVYAEADRLGASQTWWLTHETNSRACVLYDKIAHRTGHIHYARDRKGPRPGGENDP